MAFEGNGLIEDAAIEERTRPIQTLSRLGLFFSCRRGLYLIHGLGDYDLALSRVSDDLQLLIEPLGRNRHRGAKFLREEGDLELFHHPTKGFALTLRFG